MRFSLDDERFSAEYPWLSNRIRALNVRLRSYCLTDDDSYLETDDGEFPRITAVEFRSEDAEHIEKRRENTPFGKRAAKEIFLNLSLEIDYGNGFTETRPHVLRREDEAALFLGIRERSLYLFRSLYGYRKGQR